MFEASAVRRGLGAALIVLSGALAAALVRAEAPARAGTRTCFLCHADAEAVSSAGTPIFVDPGVFNVSVHAKAGLGCVGCHADLARVEDFPHPRDLAPVNCARCHPAYGPDSPAGAHAVRSPRLVARPVSCGDCHGHHDVLPSSDPGSRVHVSSVPATCGRCHAQAGPNFARGRVHELEGAAGRSPAAVVRAVYRAAIALAIAFCFAYIAVDVIRRRPER
jgi:hypothetical protein